MSEKPIRKRTIGLTALGIVVVLVAFVYFEGPWYATKPRSGFTQDPTFSPWEDDETFKTLTEGIHRDMWSEFDSARSMEHAMAIRTWLLRHPVQREIARQRIKREWLEEIREREDERRRESLRAALQPTQPVGIPAQPDIPGETQAEFDIRDVTPSALDSDDTIRRMAGSRPPLSISREDRIRLERRLDEFDRSR